MRLFQISKDGGPESHVWGYFLCEFKRLFSIVLLRFEDGSRDAYHDHAFNAVSWVLSGELNEHLYGGDRVCVYKPSLLPILTGRDTTHKVVSVGRTWVLSFRGPWVKYWHEYKNGDSVTLTNGRKAV